ncbi:class I SAM-dependent methyltransferase [Actinomadura sp. J1-007]|uniref:class I SAM-dependent methyltransferase n=1 Tax=Actinomadura sp. J1-007 TaxID=2661913 RepID=UPI0028163FA2|nr:class I SAM-dependent methyltransferase [Actinomadura sp. J1-007]
MAVAPQAAAGTARGPARRARPGRGSFQTGAACGVSPDVRAGPLEGWRGDRYLRRPLGVRAGLFVPRRARGGGRAAALDGPPPRGRGGPRPALGGLDGGGVRDVLELAAGPAEHAREFARRGVAATALDLHPAMCAYAARRAKEEGVGLDVVQEDMTAFALGRRFDLVVTMLDSTSHLMTLDAFTAHLDRAAEHLRPGGLYVVEMSHPRDRLSDDPSVSTGWTVERGDVRATVRWGEPSDRLDPVTQVSDDHVTMTVSGGGAGAGRG